jgi:hypothetical protein
MENGIQREDIYNFDETGFAMRLIATTRVVTRAEMLGKPHLIQPGQREWVTAIECIGLTGFSVFAGYHERFKHKDAHLLCRCGARKTSLHFLFCCIAKRLLPRPSGPTSETIPYLLGTPKGAAELAAWISETRFYEDICTQYPLP